jgi:hypothetical protein
MDNFQKVYAKKRIETLVSQLIDSAHTRFPKHTSAISTFVDRPATTEDKELCRRNARAYYMWRHAIKLQSLRAIDDIIFNDCDPVKAIAELEAMECEGEEPK